MYGQAAELPHEVGVGADLKVHRGRADDPAGLVLLGHQDQAAVGVDEPGQLEFVVDARVRVIGPVAGQEGLADGGDVPAGRLSDRDHGCSVGGMAPDRPGPPASRPSRVSGARSKSTSRAQRSTIREISTCSWSAWAPSPTAPSPSSVAVY